MSIRHSLTHGSFRSPEGFSLRTDLQVQIQPIEHLKKICAIII